MLTRFTESGVPWEVYWGFWALLRANFRSVSITIKLDKSECLWCVCVCVCVYVLSSTFSYTTGADMHGVGRKLDLTRIVGIMKPERVKKFRP